VRLTDGDSPNEGRAEMFRNGEWGTICDKAFGPTGWPSVFCLLLGKGNAVDAVTVRSKNLPTSSLPVVYECPACSPNDAKNMTVCSSENDHCDHYDDIYVTCEGSLTTPGP
jgi:hypothetical protein